MAAHVLADAGFLVALLSRRDNLHDWAVSSAERFPPPWQTCEAVLSEAFFLLGVQGGHPLRELLRRRALEVVFDFADDAEAVLRLMQKYGDVPASFADACLLRMTETLSDPVLLTPDSDFRTYRRHGRQAVPTVSPK